MAEPKTKPTRASVAAFLKTVEPAGRRKECQALVALLKKVTGESPRMWGTAIVGFGTYRYVYASGREGDWPLTGFSPRKASLTVYIMEGLDSNPDLMTKLGKFTTGKSCLYVKTLEDVDLKVLEQLVARSVEAMRKRYS
jgi:hypothetical protein